jgi:hypothetical protein
MSSRFERLVAFGPVLNYNDQHTWTPEIRELYRRLEGGDCSALAPLLAADLEFITDPQAMRALVVLKYDPQYPARKARVQLNRIASVVRRRPESRAKLPRGDVLYAAVSALTNWLRKHDLLKLRKHPRKLRERSRKLLAEEYPIDPQIIDRTCSAIVAGAKSVRSERSWAVAILAEFYGTDRKLIEKRIDRDEIAQALKAAGKDARRPR